MTRFIIFITTSSVYALFSCQQQDVPTSTTRESEQSVRCGKELAIYANGHNGALGPPTQSMKRECQSCFSGNIQLDVNAEFALDPRMIISRVTGSSGKKYFCLANGNVVRLPFAEIGLLVSKELLLFKNKDILDEWRVLHDAHSNCDLKYEQGENYTRPARLSCLESGVDIAYVYGDGGRLIRCVAQVPGGVITEAICTNEYGVVEAIVRTPSNWRSIIP